jgi:uncharacterized protein (TIGR02001 family)
MLQGVTQMPIISSRIKSTRRTSALLFSAAVLLAQTPSLYANDLSATLSLTSDYVFRGVSLTDGPALQGSIDYAFDNGFYIGSWTSNYDYDSATDRELDYYLGYSRLLSDDITLSASASRYTYFDEHEIDYNEYQLGLSRGALDAKAWYAIDYGGSGGDAQYFEVGFNSALPMDVSLELRAGHSIFDSQIGINDYSDLVISAKKTFGRFNSEIRLTDTDGNQFGDREDTRVFVSVSTTFQ